MIPGRIRNMTSAKSGFLHIEKIPVVINCFFLYAFLSTFNVMIYKGIPVQSKTDANKVKILEGMKFISKTGFEK